MLAGGKEQFYENKSGAPIHLETVLGGRKNGIEVLKIWGCLARVQWAGGNEDTAHALGEIRRAKREKIPNGQFLTVSGG